MTSIFLKRPDRFILVGLITFFTLSQTTFAQVSILADWESGQWPPGWNMANGWQLLSTGQSGYKPPCKGAREARTNLRSNNSQRQLSSPIWTSNGADIQIQFDYKILKNQSTSTAVAPGWGSLALQYSVDAGQNYITAFTIDDSNHVASIDCATVSVTIDGTDIPSASQMRIRWFAQWQSGDFLIFLDEIAIAQEDGFPPLCDSEIVYPPNGAQVIIPPSFPAPITLVWTQASGVATAYHLIVTNSSTNITVFDDTVSFSTSQPLGNLTIGAYTVQLVPQNSTGPASDCTMSSFVVSNPTSGYTCDNPMAITSLPAIVQSSTALFGNSYDANDRPPLPATYPPPISNGSSSAAYLNGPDFVAAYTATANTLLNISLEVPHSGLALHVFDGCPFNTLVAYSNSQSGTVKGLIQNLPINAGQTYYVVVSFQIPFTPPPPFTLTIEEVAVDCPQFFGNVGDECFIENITGSFIDETCDCVGGVAIEGNMLCTEAIGVSCGSVESGSTLNSLPLGMTSCAATINNNSGARWYRYFWPTAQKVNLSICNADFNARIRVFTGECGNLICTQFSGNCEYNRVFQGLTEYFIVVDGTDSDEEGDFELVVSCEAFDCPELQKDEGSICTAQQNAVGFLNDNCECVPEYPPVGCTSGRSYNGFLWWGGLISTDCSIESRVTNNVDVSSYSRIYDILNGVEYTFSTINPPDSAVLGLLITIADEDENIIASGFGSIQVTATHNAPSWRFYSHQPNLTCINTTGAGPDYADYLRQIEWDCSNQIYDCPDIEANIGNACDDGDSTTSFDIITSGCECQGIPFCIDLSANIGDPCDDGNPGTLVDTITAECECEGTPAIQGSCVNPELVPSVPYTASGNTAIYLNSYTAADLPASPATFPAPISNGTYTASYLNGPEAVYEYTPNQAGLMTVQLTGTVGWSSLWVFRGCPFNETVAFSNEPEAITDTRTIANLPVEAGSTYFIMISTLQSLTASTPYNLSIDMNIFDCQENSVNIGDPCDDGDDATDVDVIDTNCNCVGLPYDCPILDAYIGDRCAAPLVYEDTLNYILNDVLSIGVYSPITTKTFEIPSWVNGYYNLTINVSGNTKTTGQVYAHPKGFAARVIDSNGLNVTAELHESSNAWRPFNSWSIPSEWTTTLTLNNLKVSAGIWSIETKYFSIPFAESLFAGTSNFELVFVPVADEGAIDADCACAPLDLCRAYGGTLEYQSPISFCVGTGTPQRANIEVVGAKGANYRWGLFNSDGDLLAHRMNNSRFNLDNYPPGDYSIYYMRYEDGTNVSTIAGLSSLSALEGCWSLAENHIDIFLRPQPSAGALTALSSTTICTEDGPEMGIELALEGYNGERLRYAIVSEALDNQMVLWQHGMETGASFNLYGLPVGIYRAVAAAFTEGHFLAGLEFRNQLTGCYDITPGVLLNVTDCASAGLSIDTAQNQVLVASKLKTSSAALNSYPNPTTGNSFVSFLNPREERATLEVYDLSGRRIAQLFNQVTTPNQVYSMEFNASYLPNGIYVYRLTTDSELIIDKFMIVR